MLGGMLPDNENGTGRVSHHSLSDTSEQGSAQTRAADRSHNDESGVAFGCDLNDHRSGRTRRDDSLALDVQSFERFLQSRCRRDIKFFDLLRRHIEWSSPKSHRRVSHRGPDMIQTVHHNQGLARSF